MFKSRLFSNLAFVKYLSLQAGLPAEAMTAIATLKVESLLVRQCLRNIPKGTGGPSLLTIREGRKKRTPKQTTALLLPSWGSTDITIGFPEAKVVKLGGRFSCVQQFIGVFYQKDMFFDPI